jgi:hypothetical protein
MPRGNTVSSAMYEDLLKNHLPPAIKSKYSEYRCFAPNMTMLGPILPVQLLQQFKICPLSVFHIRHTRQTMPPVSFMSLDCSKRRWEASCSGPTKRCSRRCTSGGALSQKNLFLEVFMHFRGAGKLVWNAMETTYKNGVIVYLLCSINNEIKNI